MIEQDTERRMDMSYIERIKERARLDKKTIVLPESNDKRTLLAAASIMEEGIANIIMIGDEEKIMDGAGWLAVDLSGIKVVNPKTTEKFEDYVKILYETRKAKGMTEEKAREILLNDPLTFGIVMVKANEADGMVAGACHSTADTLRPALQILKTAPGVKLVSAFFVMDTVFKDQGDNGAFIFADCGLNQDPTAEELAAIADSSARSFKALIGPKPVIAMLSHSTKGSAKHPLVDKVAEATRIANEEYPHLLLDGELQLDAALVPSVSKSKAPGSAVGGKANVLIFPNLDAGNIGYKLVQRLGGAEAYGPMLQGIAKPVNDLSRGCSWKDIVGVVALTAVQAQLTD
jgi:phosphate acetyltransferase